MTSEISMGKLCELGRIKSLATPPWRAALVALATGGDTLVHALTRLLTQTKYNVAHQGEALKRFGAPPSCQHFT